MQSLFASLLDEADRGHSLVTNHVDNLIFFKLDKCFPEFGLLDLCLVFAHLARLRL